MTFPSCQKIDDDGLIRELHAPPTCFVAVQCRIFFFSVLLLKSETLQLPGAFQKDYGDQSNPEADLN